MKNKIVFIISVIILIFSSCMHPTPLLKLSKTGDSTTIEVKYKNPKKYLYDEAFSDGKCALFLAINHYNSIAVPVYPFSTIVNNKWYYYLYIFDTLTTGEKIKQVYTEQIKKGYNNFNGHIIALFPTKKGFVAVYSKLNKILYSAFELNGKCITNREVLFFDPELKLDDRDNTILAISCQEDCLWVFLRNEHNYNYKGQWNIHLIKRDLHQNKSEIYYNYIQTDNGWYHAKNMNLVFYNDSLAISWTDGYRQEHNPLKMNARIYLARCSVNDKECKNKTVICDSLDYNNLKTIFYSITNQTNLLVSQKDSVWKCNIRNRNIEGNQLILVNEEDKLKYLPFFLQEENKPFKLEMFY